MVNCVDCVGHLAVLGVALTPCGSQRGPYVGSTLAKLDTSDYNEWPHHSGSVEWWGHSYVMTETVKVR